LGLRQQQQTLQSPSRIQARNKIFLPVILPLLVDSSTGLLTKV
jgi:hypothetical protein